MKTLVKIRKTENLKRLQKSLLVVLILAISILPSFSQYIDSFDLKGDPKILENEKPNSPNNEFDHHDSVEMQQSATVETTDKTSDIEYFTNKFADADISLEIPNWENNTQMTGRELIMTETGNLENLFNIAPYDADKFVETEMMIESKIYTSNEMFLEGAEAYTDETCNREITKYAQGLIHLQEQKTAIQSYATVLPN